MSPLTPRRETSVHVDGARVRIAYRESGQGRPVLLLHGLGASSSVWHLVAPRLARRHRVIAPDLPGSGWSATPPPGSLATGWFTRTMNAFAREVDAEGAALVGHSLAGGVSVLMALEEPDLYASLALVAPAGMGPQLPLGLRLQALPPVGHTLALLTPLVFRALGPARLEGLMRRFVARDGDADAVLPLLREAGATYGRRAAVRAYHEVLRETATLRGQRPEYQVSHRLRELSLPTLVVWGAVDSVLPISQGRRACDACDALELRVMPGCGHVPQLEEPDAFLAILEEFLGRPDSAAMAGAAVAGI